MQSSLPVKYAWINDQGTVILGPFSGYGPNSKDVDDFDFWGWYNNFKKIRPELIFIWIDL